MTRRPGVVTALATIGFVATSACTTTQLAWYGHTPDRRRLVEVRQKGDVQWLVMGGRASRPYRAIASDQLAFDADGRRFAFAAEVQESPERWAVVVDFVEGPGWEAVAGLRFGPHAPARVTYAALDRGRWRMVIDGVAGAAFGAVDPESVVFSPDGRRVGYVSEDDGCVRTVIDDRPGECTARVVGLALADVAARDVVVVAARADGSDATVFVGGARVLDVLRAQSLTVDPGVRHWALTIGGTGGWRLVVDGAGGQTLDEIGRVVWAPDGSVVAYAARLRSAWYVVAGDRASAPYTEVEDPVFAANGSHFGFVARDPGRSVVAIDGRVVWESDAPATALTLSDDGAHRGWVYREGPRTVIAVDDQRYAFDVAIEHTLRFSRDGRHWAALVGSLSERRLFVIVDGRSRLPFDTEELFGGLRSDEEARLGAWVSAELELYLSHARGPS
jgi:hypothetical protein